MSISVSVDTSKLNELLAKVPGNKQTAVRGAAWYILGESQKSNAYKNRTGYLRGSGRVNESYGDFVNVEYGAEYAAYVERGTRKMGARPFLKPAVEKGESRLIQLLKEGLLK